MRNAFFNSMTIGKRWVRERERWKERSQLVILCPSPIHFSLIFLLSWKDINFSFDLFFVGFHKNVMCNDWLTFIVVELCRVSLIFCFFYTFNFVSQFSSACVTFLFTFLHLFFNTLNTELHSKKKNLKNEKFHKVILDLKFSFQLFII